MTNTPRTTRPATVAAVGVAGKQAVTRRRYRSVHHGARARRVSRIREQSLRQRMRRRLAEQVAAADSRWHTQHLAPLLRAIDGGTAHG
jgi:hypothetical protein